MIDDDDYPPYAPDIQIVGRLEIAPKRRDLIVVLVCGFVAGLAIGGLLLAYGVF